MGAMPLTAQDLKFVLWFRKYRDVYKAAEKARIPKNRAKRTYDRIEILEEIERQDLVVEQERARVQVQAEGISRELLDAELYTVIKLDPKKHGRTKLEAIKLGMVRAGVIQAGATRSLDLTPPNPDDEISAPTVYNAFIPVSVQASPIMPAGPAVAPVATPIIPQKKPEDGGGSPAPAVAPTPLPRATRLTVSK